MDQQTLLGIVSAVRQVLSDFTRTADDPDQALHQLFGEFDRLFSSALPRLSEEDLEIAPELQAILLDQITLLRRSHAMRHGTDGPHARTC